MRNAIIWSGLGLATLFGARGWLAAHHIASPLRAIARAARAIMSEAEAHLSQDVAWRLIAALNEPMMVGEQTVQVGCSIGAACWPQDADEPREVLRLADAALYAAKRQGKNRVAFHGEAGYTSKQEG
ncbi:MAG: diguanylate cyclase domain-containing protein [Niveispirillum sp.]|uniref:diguanylate cyclase domain-containing protein n=1 Tax=Niveispirillum sp. TaxID=1917217 RepID=UPI003BA69D78